MMTSSGSAFNLPVGQDPNGDSIFNDRPAFACRGIEIEHHREKVGHF
jgi:hypothetical protein